MRIHLGIDLSEERIHIGVTRLLRGAICGDIGCFRAIGGLGFSSLAIGLLSLVQGHPGRRRSRLRAVAYRLPQFIALSPGCDNLFAKS